MNILVDSSAFIAWFSKRDKFHDDAQSFLDDIHAGRIRLTRFIVTDYIIDETLTYLKLSINQPQLATQVGNAILRSTRIHVEHVTPEIFHASYERFTKTSGLSFTDCTSMETMDRLGLRHAFTFDDHFRQSGYTTFPT